MDDRTVDTIFQGSLENLPPVSSKIVRIFTSSTFTGNEKSREKNFDLKLEFVPRYVDGEEQLDGEMLSANQRLLPREARSGVSGKERRIS